MWAQSELEEDNAESASQAVASQHPLLDPMPDRDTDLHRWWENQKEGHHGLDFRFRRIQGWPHSLQRELGLNDRHLREIDSLAMRGGVPDNPWFWMILPWMDAGTALRLHEFWSRGHSFIQNESSGGKSGLEFMGRLKGLVPNKGRMQPLEEQWQYRLRLVNPRWNGALNLEKTWELPQGRISGGYLHGKANNKEWILGDFHLQSGNALFLQTLRIPAFAHPWDHLPGKEGPRSSPRMSFGNQVRGIALTLPLGRTTSHLEAVHSLNPTFPAWAFAGTLHLNLPEGVAGLQSAVLRPLTPVKTETGGSLDLEMLGGLNLTSQRRNYFVQSNLLVHPKSQGQGLTLSGMHTCILTPHPRWSLGLRWSRVQPSSEAVQALNPYLKANQGKQRISLNAQWAVMPSTSLGWRHEQESSQAGWSGMSYYHGLELQQSKGPLKNSRYTLLVRPSRTKGQGQTVGQYLRLPWHVGPQTEGHVQVGHASRRPEHQGWALSHQWWWKQMLRSDLDLRFGQTWVLEGPLGEPITVREEQSFGSGWWTGSGPQFRTSIGVQSRRGRIGWRLWLRRVRDHDGTHWEASLRLTQRWTNESYH